jgi:protein-tyrosine kinase
MEKIRSAIAKARAARAAEAARSLSVVNGVNPGPSDNIDAAVPDHPRTGKVASTSQDPALAAAIAARWHAFPTFLPSASLMARGHIVTFSGGEEAVHFDVMRTRLLQLMRSNGWRRVAITSPGPACGKSTLALNLAFSLGRQSELRTLLLEMDLRRPSLARMLGLRDRHHSAHVLEGLEPLAQNAVRYGENLAISTQSGAAKHPSELLHSPATAASLTAIEAEYDPALILCDLPPVFAGDDAMSVMGQMDAALIVAAAGSTTISQIDRCEREIAAQTNVIGVVLNKCRHMENDFGYDYYGG